MMVVLETVSSFAQQAVGCSQDSNNLRIDTIFFDLVIDWLIDYPLPSSFEGTIRMTNKL